MLRPERGTARLYAAESAVTPFALHPSSYLLFTFYLLLFTCFGCAVPDQDRLQQFNEDGIYLYQKGDFYRARESFEMALEKKPNDPGLLYNLAQCYDRMGVNTKAEENYRLCLEHAPEHPESRHALAQLMYRHGRSGEADQIIQGWLVSQPEKAHPYVQDAWRLQQEGDLLKAQGRLQQALGKDPNNVWALTQLGILHEARERPDLALACYEKALMVEPDNAGLQQQVNRLLSRGVKQPLPD
jgi:Tfp pilus assembly protein PilF